MEMIVTLWFILILFFFFKFQLMGENCWNCRKWEEHFYWDHLHELSFHFIKIMTNDFSEKMEFPDKFVKNFRVELIDVVALEGSDGRSWEIGLCKEEDRFFFKGGWKEFVDENQIEDDYILVFKYAGDSTFMVRIFDQTGCVKVQNPSYSNTPCRNHPLLPETIHSSKSVSRRRLYEVEKSEMVKIEEESFRKCKKDAVKLNSNSTAEMKANLMSRHDLCKLLQHKFQDKAGNCSFVKIITKSCIAPLPFVAIPFKFVSEHLPQKPLGITICSQKSKKKWFVYCKRISSSWGFYGKSFFNFAKGNKLQKGDACIFQLKKGKNATMELRILRAKKIILMLKRAYF